MKSASRSPEEIVRSGWDRASLNYRPEESVRDAFGHEFEEYRGWLAPLINGLPKGARILDLGCGCGMPTTGLLADKFEVTGVDVSEVQIERARRLVPKAKFLRADMTRVVFTPGSFRGVVALYSLIHVPLHEQRPLLGRIFEWLAPGGQLLVTTGHGAYEGIEEDWLGSGAPMFWSHADAATYRTWLEELGFTIDDQRFVPEGLGGHELFRATARETGP